MARSMGTRVRGCASAAAACAIVWLSAAPVAAKPEPPAPAVASEPPDVEDARDAYKLGVSLTKHGQWSDALAAFERSFRLKPDAVTAFDIGYCERALGRLTRARKSFGRALGAPGLPPDKAAEARGYLAEIESRLARAVITLRPGASVAVDGRPLEGSRRNRRRRARRGYARARAAGGGEHVVVHPGARSGHARDRRRCARPPRHRRHARARPRCDATLTLAPGAATATTMPAPVTEKPAAVGSARRIGAAVAFGVGGAAAVVGVVFGALALKDKADLDGVCPQKDACALGSQGTIGAMSTFATVSTVGLAAAAAGAGVGTVLVLTDDQPAPTPRAAMALSIGPGYAGVRGWF